MAEENYKPIEADKWEEMSLTDLYEQLSILQSRALTAHSMNNLLLLRQIQQGIDQCEAIISNRLDEDGSLT